MLTSLFLAAVQAASADSLLMSEFKSLCVDGNGNPAAVYAAADVAGWLPSENGAYRIRATEFGTMSVRATEIDRKWLCQVSIGSSLESLRDGFPERLGLPYRTAKNSIGDDVHILLPDVIDGRQFVRNFGADVYPESTVLTFVTRVP